MATRTWNSLGDIIHEQTGRSLVGTPGGLYRFDETAIQVPYGSVEGAVHELCHWVVASESERRQVNMGLSQDWQHPLWDRMVWCEELAWSLEFYLYGDPSVADMAAMMTPEARASGGGGEITEGEWRFSKEQFETGKFRCWGVWRVSSPWAEAAEWVEAGLSEKEAQTLASEYGSGCEARPYSNKAGKARAHFLAKKAAEATADAVCDSAIAKAIMDVVVLPIEAAALAELHRAREIVYRGGEIHADDPQVRKQAMELATAMGLPLERIRTLLRAELAKNESRRRGVKPAADAGKETK